MDFSTTLKELRQEKGLTQKELAKACNLSPQCISSLEKGINSPTAITLSALSNYFDIPIDELIGSNFTSDDRLSGISETTKITITPFEAEMLDYFRQIGKKLGNKGQNALIRVAKIFLETEEK